MNRFLYRWRHELFAFLGMLLVLWQMLLPGYILTLDMVFGPSHVFYWPTGFQNGLPITVLIYLFSYIVPAWVVEKVLLVGLFFSLFYLPLKFFPKELETPEWAKYLAALIYAVNPFVYERFLAGQWEVLAGYALLAPLVYVLLRFLKLARVSAALGVAGMLLVIGLFSIHALVMSVLFIGLSIMLEGVRRIWRQEPLFEFARSTLAMVSVFVVISGYWLVPLFFSHSSPLASFGSADSAAFMTASDQYVGAMGNVALLFGFWGEAYPWGEGFISPKQVSTFLPGAMAFFALITIGIIISMRKRPSRKIALYLVLFAALAFVFSMGLAGISHGINDWLFAHIEFWRGFRDSEKWSMWLALSYAYFAAAGAGFFVAKLWPRVRLYAICILFFVPLCYCAPIVPGFYGQLKPVWYPPSWYQVNERLASDKGCKAVFLPWHLYYSLSFNNDILTADPASAFFDCTIISGQNADIGAITIQGSGGSAYDDIQDLVTDNDLNKNSLSDMHIVNTLNKYGVGYIISTGDLVGVDPYTYPFLTEVGISPVYETGSGRANISLYSVNAATGTSPR